MVWVGKELLRVVTETLEVAAEAGVTVMATFVLTEGMGCVAAACALGVDPAADAFGAGKASWPCVSEGRFMAVASAVVE